MHRKVETNMHRPWGDNYCKLHISQYCIIIIITGKVRNHVSVSDDKLYLHCMYTEVLKNQWTTVSLITTK